MLLGLVVMAGISLWFTAWCWPRYGEQACGRYVLPVDFVMSLVIFTLVALVFDQPWGRLFLYCRGDRRCTVSRKPGSPADLHCHQQCPGIAVPIFLRYLQGALTRLIYLTLVQVLIPAAILRGCATRRDAQRITLPNAAAFGVIIGVVFTLFFAGLFWLASVIQPGSVAPGYIFTWNDFLSSSDGGAGSLPGSAARKDTSV